MADDWSIDDWLEGDHDLYYGWLDEIENAAPRYGTKRPMTEEELREEEAWMKQSAFPPRLPPLYGPPKPPVPPVPLDEIDDLPF